jgi:arabinogalactan endo-1,4-beta-galactosidase
MNINEQFPSKYLKASDLKGRNQHVTMANLASEDIGKGEMKLILYFQGKQKGMVLNKTNANNIAAIYGPETEDWVGQPIVIFEAMVDFQGKTVPALRVRAPQPKDRPKPAMTPSHPTRQIGGISDTISEDTEENPAPY